MNKKIKNGDRITKDLFHSMVLDKGVYNDEVYFIINHAISRKKLKRGYRKVLESHMSIDGMMALDSILNTICSVGYIKFMMSR